MVLSLEGEQQILKNSVMYLHNVSRAMSNNIPSVKSYYASKSRILEIRGNVYLPSKMTNAKTQCRKCCLSYEDYPPSFLLKPKKKVHRFAKKVSKKIEEGQRLTPYQRRYSESLKNINCNIMSKICQKCKNETNIVIKFPEQKADSNVAKTPLRKKRKTKDKFCGLTQSAVLDSSNKKQRKDTPIKYKVTNIIEALKNQEKIPKKKKGRKIVVQPKSTKDKIIEKKKKKATQKVQNKLKNLLDGSGKSKINRLKNFLLDL